MIYNSYGLILAAHEPFESTEAAIEKESDIHSDSTGGKGTLERKKVEDTDVGKDLKEQILDLEVLLAAYRSGVIAETVKCKKYQHSDKEKFVYIFKKCRYYW